MAEDKGALDRLLDLVVYFPVGLVTGSGDLVPTLTEKGRAFVEPRVQTARMVGQFAVMQGEREAAKLFGRFRNGRGASPAPEPGEQGLEPDPGMGEGGDAPTRFPPDPDAPAVEPVESGDLDDLAIPSYDTLAASQVISRLEGMSPVELELVRRHELAHRGRKTILAKIAELQARVIEAARRACEADASRLAELVAMATTEVRGQRGGALHLDGLAPFTADDIGRSDVLVTVGTIDEVPVGFARTRLRRLTDGGLLGALDVLYVEPGARDVGVGEAMMDAVVAWCTEQGCQGIDAVALPGDRATKNFFERFGLTARAIVVHRSLGRR